MVVDGGGFVRVFKGVITITGDDNQQLLVGGLIDIFLFHQINKWLVG